jgi:hypothetical protein
LARARRGGRSAAQSEHAIDLAAGCGSRTMLAIGNRLV